MKKTKRNTENKIVAIALVLIGYLTTLIDGDGTAFVLLLMLAVTVFLKK